jgi:serine/threonine protein kinase
MSGGTLRDVVEQHARAKTLCPFDQAVRWLADVVCGLKVIHQAGLVHRDIKPSNILLDGDSGKAVVGDLGIIRRLDSTTAGTTTTGVGLGTYRYMAPEQWQRPDQVDGRADQYALGMTFYEVLTGVLPVGSWRPASEINPLVPRQFDRVLERLLQAMPEKRYPTMEALEQDLRQWLPREEAKPAQPPAARSSRPIVTAALMLAVGLVLGFLLALGLGFYLGVSFEGTSSLPLTLRGHTEPLWSASYSPDGKRIVTASSDRTAIVWDARSGQKLLTLQGDTGSVFSASFFSADGQRIVTASLGPHGHRLGRAKRTKTSHPSGA